MGDKRSAGPWRLSVAGKPARRSAPPRPYKVVLEVGEAVLVSRAGYRTPAEATAAMGKVRAALGAGEERAAG
jgi:hypothetical protein